MLFHFPVFFTSILFLSGLEWIVLTKLWSLPIIISVICVTLLASRKIGIILVSSIIPTMLTVSSIILLYLIDSSVQQQYYILLSVLSYYLTLLGIYRLHCYQKDQTARGMLFFSGTAAIFLFMSGIYGIYLNFAVPIFVLMLLYGIGAWAVSYQCLTIINHADTSIMRTILYSSAIGLALSEIAWVINFWPFGYLTAGSIALSFYYILSDLAQSHCMGNLSKKRVFVNTILCGVLIIMVLSGTRWLPIL